MSARSQLVETIGPDSGREPAGFTGSGAAFVPSNADDVATAEDLEARRLAMEEYAAGRTIPHDAIN